MKVNIVINYSKLMKDEQIRTPILVPEQINIWTEKLYYLIQKINHYLKLITFSGWII